jgi:membrane protein required for colicin V production
MLTAFDVGVGILVLISAILATSRGLTREILSLATWAGAAAFAVFMWQTQMPLIYPGLIGEEIVAQAAMIIVSFIAALIILHLITMWIADLVVDSKIGPLDRTLGFIFGVARGVLIAVVAVIFFLWFWPSNLPTWAAESRSLPVLRDLGNNLMAMLPDDIEKQITDILQKRGIGGDEEGSPAETVTEDGGAGPDETTDELEDGSVPAGETPA